MKTVISRYIDPVGRKKLVVFETDGKATPGEPLGHLKVLGKFEILREFDPGSTEPNWKEIPFAGKRLL